MTNADRDIVCLCIQRKRIADILNFPRDFSFDTDCLSAFGLNANSPENMLKPKEDLNKIWMIDEIID